MSRNLSACRRHAPVSNPTTSPIAAINAYIAAMATDPRQLLPPLRLDNAPPDLVQTAAHLERLATDIRRAMRQKDRLADIGTATAKINHDLRNILGAATLVSDALDSSDDPFVRSAAPIVSRSISEASLLCQNMLEYLDTPPTPKPSCVKLDQLCKDLEMGIKINYQGASSLYIDKMMFKRLLLNLTRNAARAGARRIMMDIWRAGHLAVIDVSDDGPGIAPSLQPYLFFAFSSGQDCGSGLGLSIAKDLALALGGDIKLSRTGANGSEFRLQLPANVLPNP